MKKVFILLAGLLAFWGYQQRVDENLLAIYEHRESPHEIDKQLHILTAKLSKTYYGLFSGMAILPWKGSWDVQLPLDLTSEVERITRGCNTHDERVLRIYQWITNHIEYDYSYNIYTADECYRQRKGVCSAYADLLVKMLTTADIHAFKVCGYSKDLEGNWKNGHAWVIIEKGDGTFMLADPTWDAGSHDENNKLRKATLDWFDCDPKVMIHTHLPHSARHQLLENPLSEEEYKALPYLEPQSSPRRSSGYYARR